MKSVIFTILSILVIYNILEVIETKSYGVCNPCFLDSCRDIEPPIACQFGEYVNRCDRRECLKGPNAECGGPWNLLGKCGDGLVCSRNKCLGCDRALTLCT